VKKTSQQKDPIEAEDRDSEADSVGGKSIGKELRTCSPRSLKSLSEPLQVVECGAKREEGKPLPKKIEKRQDKNRRFNFLKNYPAQKKRGPRKKAKLTETKRVRNTAKGGAAGAQTTRIDKSATLRPTPEKANNSQIKESPSLIKIVEEEGLSTQYRGGGVGGGGSYLILKPLANRGDS